MSNGEEDRSIETYQKALEEIQNSHLVLRYRFNL